MNYTVKVILVENMISKNILISHFLSEFNLSHF